ncbi:MAG TPA: response regulator transcription factor [Phnomibacter sp.]|nr:response regulator transcription factor [Phnomibacter sp.]
MAIRVFVYDDNGGRQEALKMLIANTPDLEFAGARENCATVEEDMRRFEPDVVLMDIDMPMVNGIEGLKRIKTISPSIFIIMQTVFENDEKIFEAIRSGADGYFLKKTPPDKLIDGIRDVLDGGAPMTPLVARKVLGMFQQQPNHSRQNRFDLTTREIEILNMLTKGLSYKMIADAQKITYHTVNGHLKKIYEKLQVHSATEAVAKALDQRIV